MALAESWGNPSSAHDQGSRARRLKDEARAKVAHLAGCHDDEVYFTSGGTEADNWAIQGTLESLHPAKSHWITVATEHHAVLDLVKWSRNRGYEVTVLSPDGEGLLQPEQVLQSIRPGTAMVSVMHVNNELGTIQPVEEIGAVCRERGVIFHTDAVQSFGKIPLRFSGLNADLMSISSHKIYGPKGAGALIIGRGTRISPRQIGGSQERGLRPGTENMPGIVGMGAAAERCHERMSDDMAHTSGLRDRLEAEVLASIPDVRVNGSRTLRAPGILNVSFTGCEGEALLIALDRKGFCVSTGSACSAGAIGASHVLIGIGLDPVVAQSSIRFSFGRFNEAGDVTRLMEILPPLIDRQRALAPAAFR